MNMEGNYKNGSRIIAKKRVLFVITQSEFGGAQRFLDMLVSHLPKDSYEILVATGKDGGGGFLAHLHKHGFATHKLIHLVRPPHPYHDLLAVWELRRLIKSFKPDTLFLLSSKSGVIGSLACRSSLVASRPKIVYRIGGWSFNDPQPQWKKKLWIKIEKKTAKYKDIIIVNNKHDLDQAKQLGIRPHGSLELIYNGLDMSEINFLSREEARSKLMNSAQWIVDSQMILVGTIANFYPTKGLKYLIEAVEQLQETRDKRQVKFVVIGDGELRSKLELLIADYQLQDQVILIGRLEDAKRYLKAFDIYIQPSVKEGFPWAVLEAMAAGLPVIATSVGAIPEVIQDGQSGLLVEPGNPTQLADKLGRLLSDEQLRTSLGVRAQQTITQSFSFAKMLERIKSLL